MARVLVTGGNGFLGSWTVRALVNEGHEVRCLVKKSSDLSELGGVACHYCYGDITDRKSVFEATKDIDSVFHLAGLISYKERDRALMEKINVQGTQNIIDACFTNRVRRLVHVSSVVAVGAAFSSNQILSEESEYNLTHLNMAYFETKRKAEQLVIEAAHKQLDAVIVNPSTVYGGGDAKKGSRKTQLKVAQGKMPFYTSGGVNVVAVEDVVAGILSAWKKGRTGERYILAGENILIKDLFAMIADISGVHAPKILIPNWLMRLTRPLGDQAWTAILFHWFDSSKAQRELDFHPRPARQAVESSIRWSKAHGLV